MLRIEEKFSISRFRFPENRKTNIGIGNSISISQNELHAFVSMIRPYFFRSSCDVRYKLTGYLQERWTTTK